MSWPLWEKFGDKTYHRQRVVLFGNERQLQMKYKNDTELRTEEAKH